MLAGVFILAANHSPQPKLKTFAAGLVVAAAIYIAFAAIQAADWRTISIEIVGLLLYSGLAWKGWKGDPKWLIVGWGTHSLWDAGLHLGLPMLSGSDYFWQVGTVPQWYVLFCLSFDITIAAYLYNQTKRLSGKKSRERL